MRRFKDTYGIGTKFVNLYSKQIKGINFKNFNKMRTIYVTILAAIISVSTFANTSVDTTYSKEWNSKLKTWEQTERIITVSQNGLVDSELMQVQQDGNWMNYYFNTISYNNGQVIEEFEQYWNERKLKWEDNYRKLYSYDKAGNPVQILHQNIFNGEYINTSKEIMIYTADGDLKEKVIQNYDEAWTNFLKYQYYFLEQDMLTEENLTYWDGTDWNGKSFSTIYTYNTQGDLASTVKLEKSANKETKLNKQEFVYNNDGQLTAENSFVWKKGKSNWKESSRTKFEFDNNGNTLAGTIQMINKNGSWSDVSYIEFPEAGKLIEGTDFLARMTCEIHCDDFQSKARLKFSNPDKEVYQIRIVDEFGEIVSTDITSRNSISFNIGNLHQGDYFVELQGRNLFSGKFSIE